MATILSYSIRDYLGNQVSVPFYLTPGLALSDYQEWQDTMSPLLDNLTGGVIVSAQVTVDLTLPVGLTSSATSGLANQEGANMIYSMNNPYTHSIRVPAFVQSLLSGTKVDSSNQQVINFNDHITTAFSAPTTGTNVSGVNRFDEDLVSFVDGTLTFRKR